MVEQFLLVKKACSAHSTTAWHTASQNHVQAAFCTYTLLLNERRA